VGWPRRRYGIRGSRPRRVSGQSRLNGQAGWFLQTVSAICPSSEEGGRSSSARNGGGMDRYATDRVVERLVRPAGMTERVPHSLRHSFITPPSTPACR
jgi:integrase